MGNIGGICQEILPLYIFAVDGALVTSTILVFNLWSWGDESAMIQRPVTGSGDGTVICMYGI